MYTVCALFASANELVHPDISTGQHVRQTGCRIPARPIRRAVLRSSSGSDGGYPRTGTPRPAPSDHSHKKKQGLAGLLHCKKKASRIAGLRSPAHSAVLALFSSGQLPCGG